MGPEYSSRGRLFFGGASGVVYDYSGCKWVFKTGEGWDCAEDTTDEKTDYLDVWDCSTEEPHIVLEPNRSDGSIMQPKKHEVKNLSKSQRDQFDDLLSC